MQCQGITKNNKRCLKYSVGPYCHIHRPNKKKTNKPRNKNKPKNKPQNKSKNKTKHKAKHQTNKKTELLLLDAVKEQNKLLNMYGKHIQYFKPPTIIIRVSSFYTCQYCDKTFATYRFPNAYFAHHRYSKHNEDVEYSSVECMLQELKLLKTIIYDRTIKNIQQQISTFKKDETYLVSLMDDE